MNRRGFLELWSVLAGVVVVAACLPTLAFWKRFARNTDPNQESWLDVGPARKVPEGRWLAVRLTVQRTNRWRQDATEELLYVLREGRSIRMLSPICPHQGCLVQQEGEGFVCPCHRSSFDGDGRSLEGPSPRPLDELEWKVEGGRLKVRYRRFRSGRPEVEPLEA